MLPIKVMEGGCSIGGYGASGAMMLSPHVVT